MYGGMYTVFRWGGCFYEYEAEEGILDGIRDVGIGRGIVCVGVVCLMKGMGR